MAAYRHDGLTGGVTAGVVVVPTIRAAFGVAARPWSLIDCVDTVASAIICEPQSGEQVS
jgi:hypothetical protein